MGWEGMRKRGRVEGMREGMIGMIEKRGEEPNIF